MTNDHPAEGAWSRFWFTPIPKTGYHVLRVLAGSLFLYWLLSALGHQAAFFSFDGWLDMPSFNQARQEQEAGLPPIGWSLLFLAGQSRAAFQGMYWASVVIIALFTLGIATRITGIMTWVIVASFLANPITSWEGDYLLAILAFHLMVGHLLMGMWQGNPTLLERVIGSKDDFILSPWLFPEKRDEPRLSSAANWSLRMLQIHFAIIIVTSGLHKLQIDDWWAGAALWYPLHPPFQTTADTLDREKATAGTTIFILSFVQYLVLAWQIAFPVFAWRRGVVSRTILLVGAAIGWIGALFLFKLPTFGPFVMFCSLSFLSADEWAWIKAKLLAMWSRSAERKAEREPAKTAITVKK